MQQSTGNLEPIACTCDDKPIEPGFCILYVSEGLNLVHQANSAESSKLARMGILNETAERGRQRFANTCYRARVIQLLLRGMGYKDIVHFPIDSLDNVHLIIDQSMEVELTSFLESFYFRVICKRP